MNHAFVSFFLCKGCHLRRTLLRLSILDVYRVSLLRLVRRLIFQVRTAAPNLSLIA